MVHKREEQVYQPEVCLNCRKIWRVNCEIPDDYELKWMHSGFKCVDSIPFKPINGKKK